MTIATLQAAIAAEHAAVYGYGVAGAHLTGASQGTARQYWLAHMQARDTLAAMIKDAGFTPEAPKAFYELPFSVHDAASAMALAAHIEDGVTAAYLGIVGSGMADRTFGAVAVQVAAGRATHWRGTTTAFPGLPDSALRLASSGPVPVPVSVRSGPVRSGSGDRARLRNRHALAGSIAQSTRCDLGHRAWKYRRRRPSGYARRDNCDKSALRVECCRNAER